jgi:hypothetical protein
MSVDSEEETIKLTYEVLLRLQDEPECQVLGNVFKTLVGVDENISLKQLIERLDSYPRFQRLRKEIELCPCVSEEQFQCNRSEFIELLLVASDFVGK